MKIRQSRESQIIRSPKTPAPSRQNTRPHIRRFRFASPGSDDLSEDGDRQTEFEAH